MGGIYLQLYDTAVKADVQVLVKDHWTTVARLGRYMSEWIPLPAGVSTLRISNETQELMRIAEITVYGEGEKPASVPVWTENARADLLLLVAHPDDELLWFGGFLPTYGCEMGYSVQVVYLTMPTGQRKLELLDGLWTCGISAYPVTLGFRDVRRMTLDHQYAILGKDLVYQAVSRVINRFKPSVILTHDINGEYGHGAHRVCADTMIDYVYNLKVYGQSLSMWEPKKVYIHLYPYNRIWVRWDTSLTSFGGKTGIQAATEALACHKSQTAKGWSMDKAAEYDNEMFGLYYTTVGPDILRTGFMEHVTRYDALMDKDDTL